MESTALDILGDDLAITFPATTDAPLARIMLTELAAGEPVTLAQLCAAARQRADVVSAALSRWPNVAYDDHGAVIAFSGLSLRPTAHSFCLPGRALFAWCVEHVVPTSTPRRARGGRVDLSDDGHVCRTRYWP